MLSHSPHAQTTIKKNSDILSAALNDEKKNETIPNLIKERVNILNRKKFATYLLSLNPNDDFAKFCLAIFRAQNGEINGMTDLLSQIQNTTEWPVDLMLADFYQDQDRESAIFHVKLAAENQTDLNDPWTLELIDIIKNLLSVDEQNLDPEEEKISRELLLIVFNLFKSFPWDQENSFSVEMTNLGKEIQKMSGLNEQIAEKIRLFLETLQLPCHPNLPRRLTYEKLLITATKTNNIDWVKMLVPLMQSCRESLNIKDSEGRTILIIAIISGHDEIARYLIHAGANVNEEYKNEYNVTNTPIMYASMRNKADIVQLLIDKGARCNNAGYDAIDIAIQHGHEDIIHILMREGAEIHLKTQFNNYLFRESKDVHTWQHSIAFFTKISRQHYLKNPNEAAVCLREGARIPTSILKASTEDFLLTSMMILEHSKLTYEGRWNILFAIFSMLLVNNINDINYFSAEQWDRLAVEALGYFQESIQGNHFALQAAERAEEMLPLDEATALFFAEDEEEKTELKKHYQKIKKEIETTRTFASYSKFFSLNNPENFKRTYEQFLPCMEKQSAELIQDYVGKSELDTPSVLNMTFKSGGR